MNRRFLSVLAVLALALVAGWYFTSQVSRPKAPPQAELWLPGLQVPQVKAIEVQRAGQPLVRLERGEQGWALPAKAGYPADQGAANQLLNALVEARKLEPRTANPELYGRLGLADKGDAEQQGIRIKLEQGEHPLQLLIGKPGQQDGQLVRRADEAQSWLVNQRIELPPTELAWLDRRVIDVPFAEIHTLEMRHASGEQLKLFRDKAEDINLQVRDLPKGKRLAFDGAANGAGLFFADLRFSDAAPLAQVSFTGTPALQFDLTTFGGRHLKGSLYGKAEQYWLVLDPSSDLLAVELPARAGWAYRLDAYQYQSLAKKLTDLLAAN